MMTASILCISLKILFCWGITKRMNLGAIYGSCYSGLAATFKGTLTAQPLLVMTDHLLMLMAPTNIHNWPPLSFEN